MRISAITALAVTLLIGPAHLSLLQQCPERFGLIHEYTDVRARAVLLEIIAKAHMDPREFALCQHHYVHVPEIKRFDDTVHAYVVLMPGHAEKYSREQLRGLLGHEVAHVVFWGAPRTIETEMKVDHVAIGWVGKDALVEGLTVALAEFDLFPAEVRNHARSIYIARVHQIDYRMSSR